MVGYVVERGGFGNGRIKAGNEMFLKWSHHVRISEHFQTDVWGEYSYRGTYFYGTSGDGVGWQNKRTLMSPTNYTDVGLSIFYVPSVHHSTSLLEVDD